MHIDAIDILNPNKEFFHWNVDQVTIVAQSLHIQ